MAGRIIERMKGRSRDRARLNPNFTIWAQSGRRLIANKGQAMDSLREFSDAGGGIGSDYDSARGADTDDAALSDTPGGFGTDERRMHVRAYNYWAKLLGNRSFPSIEDLDPANIEDFGSHSVLLDFTGGIENPAIPFIGGALRAECELEGPIRFLHDVPGRSLLSRITDHYLQIIANRAPIGFEAEFVNQKGATILYRGILLPFSSDDDTIDFIYGVLNWKQLADADTSAALAAAVGPIADVGEAVGVLTEWADGPDGLLADADDDPLPLNGYEVDAADLADFAVPEPDADAGLADWLVFARAQVEESAIADERSRAALYAAIGRAYDFAMVARERPDEYAELLEEACISAQARAPMTPVVKLVFGPGYDKTRLAEYAAVLGYAMRNAVPRGGLARLLAEREGGLKAVVRDERAARRAKDLTGRAPSRGDKARSLLRAVKPRSLDSIDPGGAEFLVLLARRDAAGELGIVATLPEEDRLAERLLCRAASAVAAA